MKRHAKAPSTITAASGEAVHARRTILGIACLCVLGLVAFLGSGAPSAGAADPNGDGISGPPGIPDRNYELVSPGDKNGSEVSVRFGFNQASELGGSLAWSSSASFAGAPAAVQRGAFVSRRTSNGWLTSSATPPQDPATPKLAVFRPLGFSSNLSHQVFQHIAPALVGSPAPGIPHVYASNLDSGAYSLLTDFQGGVPPLIVPAPQFAFRGASKDFERVLFSTDYQLTADANPAAPNAYEWNSVTGEVQDVGLLPDGSHAQAAVGSYAAGSAGGTPARSVGAQSEDGSRVYFTAVDPNSFVVQLYQRRDGLDTVHVSASQRTDGTGAPDPDPAGTRVATFWAATAKGDRAFFTSCEKLTNDAVAVADDHFIGCDAFFGFGDPRNDLYMYDEATGALTDLTTADPAGADVRGVLGASRTGDRVYFVALGVLAGGAVAGEPNLYLWDEAAGVTFIATLDHTDNVVWKRGNDGGVIPGASAALPPDNMNQAPARVNPTGEVLAFQSVRGLTGQPTGGFTQVYRFDLTAPPGQRLQCVSCRPDGEPGTAGATLLPPAINIGAEAPMHLSRRLSDDGERLFFDTSQPLVPADTNGRIDVYLYEDGTAKLISSGASESDSFFVDASASGDDVFIQTRESLVGWDVGDSDMDVYNARVDGGFSEPPAEVRRCEGDECQGVAADAPAASTIASSAFRGVGNLGSARCDVTGRRATRIGSRAERLARRAERVRGRNPARAEGMQRRARRLTRRAKSLNEGATRCRARARADRGGGR